MSRLGGQTGRRLAYCGSVSLTLAEALPRDAIVGERMDRM